MHHGHTAMFGTYGMLSVSLLLFSWRGPTYARRPASSVPSTIALTPPRNLM
jgi:nitric oxide reductase large subunit